MKKTLKSPLTFVMGEEKEAVLTVCFLGKFSLIHFEEIANLFDAGFLQIKEERWHLTGQVHFGPLYGSWVQ